MGSLLHRPSLPTPRELTVLAERYAHPSQMKQGIFDWRSLALQIFQRAAPQPELTAEARAVLREALKHPEVLKARSRGGLIGLLDGVERKLDQMNKNNPKEDPQGAEEAALRAALVALGEPDPAAPHP
jgi:hypothetical protein